jgi:hypothetical protein
MVRACFLISGLEVKDLKILKVLGLLLVLCPLASASKITDWQTGKLASLDATSIPSVHGGFNDIPVSSSTRTTCQIGILAEGVEYFADFRCNPRHGAQLTENGEIKYHVEKDSLWFLDERGKEYKCRIFKRRKLE